MSGPVIITARTAEAIGFLRNLGITNMFNYPRVIQGLLLVEDYKTATWIQENPVTYARGLMRGFKIGEENDTD